MTYFTDLAQQKVVIDIGQIDAAERKSLAKAVRAGRIKKWRGYWYPIPGAAWGIGPLKSCYGPLDYPLAKEQTP